MSRSPVEQGLLFARTVRHLRPAQAFHRGRLRAQKAALATFPSPLEARWRRPVPAAAGWPAGYRPLDGRTTIGFPDPAANAAGAFEFVGERRRLGEPADWQQAGAPHLWRYHLHYFDWAWSFLAAERGWAREAFARLWHSWRRATRFGRRDAWAPYVVSLRAWALCGVYEALVAGQPFATAFLENLALHAGFVRSNLEQDVGGNHLIKNLKALIGLGVFLHDDALFRDGLERLQRQLRLQVLADGGHYERSPSYHCQVLGDLIDVCDLLEAADRPRPQALAGAVSAMRGWLGAMLLPDGDVPLLNDACPIGRERLELLAPTPVAEPLLVLQPSGYVVARPAEGTTLVADVGLPCPPDLPAHAHADCLSFVLSVHGQRVVVDTGTSTYAPGPVRDYERSTRAHNTVEIDGQNQTEVWGAFRAARRATPLLEAARLTDGLVEVRASHDGYERLAGRPRHRRTLRVGRSQVDVIEEVLGAGRHSVSSFLHLAPGLAATWKEHGRSVQAGPVTISTTPDGPRLFLQEVDNGDGGWVASGFGRRDSAALVHLPTRGDLPVRLTLTIAW